MPTDPDILAALRKLPPETVADVRLDAAYARANALLASDRTRAEWAARARRLSALADILDTLTTEPR